MILRCLSCDRGFRPNNTFVALPRGRRVAFDAARRRIWLICSRCHHWTLQPVASRAVALHELERACVDRGRSLARTAHVELLQVERLLLVRLGETRLPERAWWRHGGELRRRRHAYASVASRVSALTFGALRRGADLLGLSDTRSEIHWDDDARADILRWRRFGWAAWRGRVRCPFCNSTLRALTYDLSWWSYPLMDGQGRLELGVPCTRCDPWTPEHIYRIRGRSAEDALRRVLAYQHIQGADERTLESAVEAIGAAGSPGAFTEDVAGQGRSLWKLGRVGAVALEISLAESGDRRLLEMDARALEFRWRREEELARIMDEELGPDPVIP